MQRLVYGAVVPEMIVRSRNFGHHRMQPDVFKVPQCGFWLAWLPALCHGAIKDDVSLGDLTYRFFVYGLVLHIYGDPLLLLLCHLLWWW